MRETNAPKRGVFWIIDGELYAFVYKEGKYPRALAKSKVTYTHKNLWREVCPKGCNKPYNYYPRGRVHIRQDGSVHIYLNPNITEEFLPKIKTFFGITCESEIHYEYTAHYRCYLDTNWSGKK